MKILGLCNACETDSHPVMRRSSDAETHCLVPFIPGGVCSHDQMPDAKKRRYHAIVQPANESPCCHSLWRP